MENKFIIDFLIIKLYRYRDFYKSNTAGLRNKATYQLEAEYHIKTEIYTQTKNIKL